MGHRNKKVDQDDVIGLTSLLAMMVESIVEFPEDVSITVSNGVFEIKFSLDVADDDIRHVLGHHRVTFDAICRVLTTAARARGVMVALEFPRGR